MIHGHAKMANIEDAALTIQLTATVAEWRVLRERMTGRYPDWQLSACIAAAISKVFAQVDVVQEVGE